MNCSKPKREGVLVEEDDIKIEPGHGNITCGELSLTCPYKIPGLYL